jgi:hypothetical protein
MPGCREHAEVEYNRMMICIDCWEKEKHRMDGIYLDMENCD